MLLCPRCNSVIAMGRSCKFYMDRLFGRRCYVNVIEVADIIARWDRLNVPILRLKRLPLRRVSLMVSYFEIVFSVLTGFSVNFTLRKQAVGIYLGIYKDMH